MKRAVAFIALATLFAPAAAHAFPAMYAGTTEARVTNNATQIVVMREKNRTVLSILPDYQGPPEAFALIIPVPSAVTKSDVKTFSRMLFDRVDVLTAPRLVEYWELDPCAPGTEAAAATDAGSGVSVTRGFGGLQGPKVEAHFSVAEYDISVLGASESGGLVEWLKKNKYVVPPGAEEYLKPLAEAGSHFVVAKIDGKRLPFQNGVALYSPIRVTYESDRLTLPLRFGLGNSSGVQEVIVHVLARHQRYEAANYPNAFAPTNIDVADGAKTQPSTMYNAIFDVTTQRNPRAWVTEYAWDATSCDPCTTPPLVPDEFLTLGADVMGSAPSEIDSATFGSGFVLTRLHARYRREDLTEDLVLRAADPVAGGREERTGGVLSHAARPAPSSAFEARYAVRHAWTGGIACDRPRRGVWGATQTGQRSPTQAAARLPYAPRAALKLSAYLREDVPELGFTLSAPDTIAPAPATPPPAPSSSAPAKRAGCGGCTVGAPVSSAAAPVALAIFAIAVRRRRAPR